MSDENRQKPSYRAQVIASILFALLITVVVVSLVTSKLGTGMTRERYEEREDFLEEREEREDRLDD